MTSHYCPACKVIHNLVAYPNAMATEEGRISEYKCEISDATIQMLTKPYAVIYHGVNDARSTNERKHRESINTGKPVNEPQPCEVYPALF